jgi:S1-C subfamily serine protease
MKLNIPLALALVAFLASGSLILADALTRPEPQPLTLAPTTLTIELGPQADPVEAALDALWRIDSEGHSGSAAAIGCVPLAGGGYVVTFLTAGHVVQDEDQFALRGEHRLAIAGKLRHPTLDVAVLAAQSPVPQPVLQVRSGLRQGEVVSAMGYGLDSYELVVATGRFGARVATMPMVWGCSGGPVVDAQGRLVGVVSTMAQNTQLGVHTIGGGLQAMPLVGLTGTIPVTAFASWLSVR